MCFGAKVAGRGTRPQFFFCDDDDDDDDTKCDVGSPRCGNCHGLRWLLVHGTVERGFCRVSVRSMCLGMPGKLGVPWANLGGGGAPVRLLAGWRWSELDLSLVGARLARFLARAAMSWPEPVLAARARLRRT